jgi:oligopeptide/dipeptide ABC transporter ATP-binding protein
MTAMQDDNLIQVKNLKMYFPITSGLFRRKVGEVKAVDDISFEVKKHETLGLVGESGCGKTTTGRCVLRLYRPTSGRIMLNGQDISALPENRIRPLRRYMSCIFQDPYGSLNPRENAGKIVGTPLVIQRMAGGRDLEEKVEEIFRLVGLDPSMMDRFPHEFSGGQRQRLGIARALACRPSLVVCDEPISALDVSIQAQIINLLEDLQEKLGLTYLFIAHDLSVVQHISNRVAIMYLGRIVEVMRSVDLTENPLHPYSRALLSAIPVPDPFQEEKRTRIVLKGEVPSPVNPPGGCHFHPRCNLAVKECGEEIPQLKDMGNGHQVACHRV